MKKTIIFDFDGTLADTVALNQQIMNELALLFGFKQTVSADIERLKQMSVNQVLQFLQLSPYKVPLVLLAVKLKLRRRIGSLNMAAEFVDLLQKLASQCQFGIVSTNSNTVIRRFIAQQQLPEMAFIYANTRLNAKAATLQKAVQQQQLQLSHSLYVGDEIRDVAASKSIDMPCAAVSWGYNSKSVLAQQQPTYLVDNVAQLATALEHFINQQ